MADTTQNQGSRYTVTARKYRPQTFDDLVAQEHVAETLRNAISRQRLAHAYLFSGPRGVGKTTAARILAKAVNCQTPLGQRPDAEPCRACDSCQAFEEGRSLNIIEIDAASNNRVEDIRELRDTVRVPPQGAKKKVYILDEVHMLSASAFNALLKTLEEPPDYALFIFATTEPHKVLPTILSRTQRFDFRRIAVPEIVSRLEEISAAEGVTADAESLVLLARKGDGALRDALSIYDQAVSICGQTLEIGALRQALGVVDADVYFDATERASAGDRAGLLAAVDGVVRSGHDLAEFVHGLADHLRNLLVARSTQSGDLIEGTLATKERYLDAAQPYAESDLLHLLMLAEQAAGDLRESRQPRLALELALLKMASLQGAADLDRLLRRLDALETAARGGTLPPSALTSAPAPTEATPAPAATAASAAASTPSSGVPPPASQASATSPPAATPPAPTPRPTAPSVAPTPALAPRRPATGGPSAQTGEPKASYHASADSGASPGDTSASLTTSPLPGGDHVGDAGIGGAEPGTSRALLPTSAPALGSLSEDGEALALRDAEALESPVMPASPSPAEAPPASASVGATDPPVEQSPPVSRDTQPGGYELPPLDAYESGPSGPPPDEDGGVLDESPPRPQAPTPPVARPDPMPTPAIKPVFGRPALRRPTGGDGQSAEASLATGDGQPGAAPGAPADPLGPALATLTDAWPRFVAAVRDQVGIRVGAIVRTSAPFRVSKGAVEVAMDDAFGVTVATDNDKQLSAVLAEVIGAEPPPLRWVQAPKEVSETAPQADPFEALKQMRQNHPVVKALFDSFGAEIVWQ